MLPHKSFAKDLDEILNYTTTVEPRDDGSFGYYHAGVFDAPPPRGGLNGGMFGEGSSGGSDSGSSCACACACAGGGRAGCAKKDFYGTNLKV